MGLFGCKSAWEKMHYGEIMNLKLLVLIASLIFALAFFVVRNDKKSVHEDSIRSWIPHYAENVRLFYDASNRFPDSKLEIAENIFGSWSSNYTFAVIDKTHKTFSITAIEMPGRTMQFHFQLSNTSVIQLSK